MTDKIDDKYGFDKDSQCCSDWRDCSVYKQLQQANKQIEKLTNDYNKIYDYLQEREKLINECIKDASIEQKRLEESSERLDIHIIKLTKDKEKSEQKLKQIEEISKYYNKKKCNKNCNDSECENNEKYCNSRIIYKIQQIIKDGE